jgi:type IV secretory pathway VirB10-like protein
MNDNEARHDDSADKRGAATPAAGTANTAAAAPVAAKTGEANSAHGKRAMAVAAVLVGLVLLGLMADAMFSTKKAPAPPKDDPKPVAAQDPFADFEAKRRAELARLEAERRQKKALDPAAPEFAASAAISPEQALRDAARLEDLKRGLAALKSPAMAVDGRAGGADSAVAAAGAAPGGAGGGNSARAEATLVQLNQAIERARGANPGAATGTRTTAAAAPDEEGGDELAGTFTRELRGAQAASAIVGQTASARRDRGERARRAGDFLVPVGAVMSAVLDMEINSDWEGRWRALLIRDVYDVSQEYILLPKGTRILGTTAKAKVVNEPINERMALAARWAVLPNGARIDLSRAGVLDPSGVGAIGGDVDRHFLAQLGGVAAFGVIGGLGSVAALNATGGVGEATISLGRSAGAEIAGGLVEVGKRVATRYLNLVPTIVVKPGTPMTIFLDDELYLKPWAPINDLALPLAAGAAR